jgi:hypothetical protein
MVPYLDVVTVNAPLHSETRGLFNDEPAKRFGTIDSARSSSKTTDDG